MRSAQKTRIGTLVVFASATLAGVANAQAQSRDETVSISDPRPLAKTAETLIKRYGVPVSYEDVSAYTYEGDFSESREVQTTHWGARVLAPRGGSITLTLPKANLPAVPLTTATVEGFLGTAAAQHQAAGNPGRFQILETLAGPAIVPVANRDSSGVLIQDRSLLDFRVTFPEMDRDIESALETFQQSEYEWNRHHEFPGSVQRRPQHQRFAHPFRARWHDLYDFGRGRSAASGAGVPAFAILVVIPNHS